MPIVRQVQHEQGAREALGGLPEPFCDVLREQLEAFRARDLPVGDHVELLVIDGRAVRVNFFVDTDGTLWIERLGVSGP
ncbi:MAG: hypothetical protein KIT58_16355 [Planctomycetota bacterium]|nr:hypothetical protein [Planctomycetota bacterium]